jgi:hypothetical protein
MMERESSTQKRSIAIDGKQDTEPEIVYFCHMIVIYIIIVTSISNLSLPNGKSELWITLLSSTIGYALPSPSLKTSNT